MTKDLDPSPEKVRMYVTEAVEEILEDFPRAGSAFGQLSQHRDSVSISDRGTPSRQSKEDPTVATYDFDLLVLGAGQGGLPAAHMAAKLGARVALVEPAEVGGT